MSRANRRHHAARLKARFRKIVKHQWNRRGPTLSEAEVAVLAAKNAAHAPHDCFICRKPRYERDPFDWIDEVGHEEDAGQDVVLTVILCEGSPA